MSSTTSSTNYAGTDEQLDLAPSRLFGIRSSVGGADVGTGTGSVNLVGCGLRGGVGTITAASPGNAAVSTAVGAAAAGLRAVIFVSSDCQPEKLALTTQAGAWVFQVPEGYAAAVDLSRAARMFGWFDRNTGANPVTIEAKKTVAFEVWEQLGPRIPDLMIAPVGDGLTLVALDKGFGELVHCGLAKRQPGLIGVQAERCQPLVRTWLGAEARPAELDPTATVADGIAVVRPAIGDAVLDVMRRCGGGMVAVTDDALLRALTTLAGRAGVGAERVSKAAATVRGRDGFAEVARVLAERRAATGVTPERIDEYGSDYIAFIEAGIPAAGCFTGDDEVKTRKQAALWGGKAGAVCDPCYHESCDRLNNINVKALDRYTDAAAGTIAHFAISVSDLPAR
jgi:Pyridoxal-phosphate dependent enzyme/Peptidase family M28